MMSLFLIVLVEVSRRFCCLFWHAEFRHNYYALPLCFVCTFFFVNVSMLSLYRRLPGCVVMGINRTRRLFGRQKKDAWAASQYTLYGFRPRRSHFPSPLFLFFSSWSKKLHFRYAYTYFLDIYDTLEQSKEHSRVEFWLDGRYPKRTIYIGFTSVLHSFTFAEEVLRTFG